MGLFSSFFGSPPQPPEPSPDAGEPLPRFRAGQVWSIHPPPDQPHAKVTILSVEDGGELGRIVHVALSGLSYGSGSTTMQHLPFAEAAVLQSVTRLDRESGPVPDFAEGYEIWREAFDAGQGGVFTVPVSEAFQQVTGAIRSRNADPATGA